MQSLRALALFWYMGVTQELENLGHTVIRHEKFIGGNLGPVGLVLPAVHVGHGHVKVHGGNPRSLKLGTHGFQT